MADEKQTSRVVAEPGELTVKVNVDASDAIKALKAIQREAREATKALRELEALRGSMKPSVVDTLTPWINSGKSE